MLHLVKRGMRMNDAKHYVRSTSTDPFLSTLKAYDADTPISAKFETPSHPVVYVLSAAREMINRIREKQLVEILSGFLSIAPSTSTLKTKCTLERMGLAHGPLLPSTLPGTQQLSIVGIRRVVMHLFSQNGGKDIKWLSYSEYLSVWPLAMYMTNKRA